VEGGKRRPGDLKLVPENKNGDDENTSNKQKGSGLQWHIANPQSNRRQASKGGNPYGKPGDKKTKESRKKG